MQVSWFKSFIVLIRIVWTVLKTPTFSFLPFFSAWHRPRRFRVRRDLPFPSLSSAVDRAHAIKRNLEFILYSETVSRLGRRRNERVREKEREREREPRKGKETDVHWNTVKRLPVPGIVMINSWWSVRPPPADNPLPKFTPSTPSNFSCLFRSCAWRSFAPANAKREKEKNEPLQFSVLPRGRHRPPRHAHSPFCSM